MDKKSNQHNKAVFNSVITKILTEIKIGVGDALNSLKIEFYAKGNTTNKKVIIALKGIILVALGIYAIAPVYNRMLSVIVGATFGFFSAVRAWEDLKATSSLIKGAAGIVFGAFFGTLMGAIPLIGVGITVGVTKATIESFMDMMRKSLSMQSFISILSDRVKIGLLAGIVPIVGPLIANDKINREREELHPAQKNITPISLKTTNSKVKLPKK